MVGGLLTAILFKLLLSREGGGGTRDRKANARYIHVCLFRNFHESCKTKSSRKNFFSLIGEIISHKNFFSLLIREILSRKVCFWLSPRLQRPYHKLRVYYFDVLFITMRWKTQNLVLSPIHVYFQHFNPIVFEIFVRKYLFFLNSRT